jgi:hypothetical protein
LYYPGKQQAKHKNITEFLIKHLRNK